MLFMWIIQGALAFDPTPFQGEEHSLPILFIRNIQDVQAFVPSPFQGEG